MTISAPEAQELASSSAAIPRDAAQRVLDYILFHRSLIGEAEDAGPRLLDRYMTLVKNLKEGIHVVILDPVQKATALLFELVMEEEFDPWEIDLVRFTQAYLDRVKSVGEVDFTVAGRLLYMAWSILYLQSEQVLKLRDLPIVEPVGITELGDGTGDGPIDDLSTDSAETLGFESGVPDEQPSLAPMIRHPETRPVSLLELVRAFGEAEEEARRSLRIQELRERLREEQRAPPQVLVHGDVPAEDLADAWELVRRHPVGERFPLLDLWSRATGRDRLVAVFLATLFLVRENSIELEQPAIAKDPILVVRLGEERSSTVEA